MNHAPCLWALLLLGALQDPVPPRRAPVPDAARLKKAETDVRDVFRDEYAKKSPAERKAFALKLLQNAVDTRDDLTVRYVLLKEAATQASLGADFITGLRAIDELAFSFNVEPISLKFSLLAEAAKMPGRALEEHRALAEAWLYLQQQAVAADAFDVAEQAIAGAVTAARLSKELVLANRAETRAKELGAARQAAEQLRRLRETLAKNPNDVSANFTVGRHECFTRGNWAAGLPLLVKSGDPGLSELASRDLANPASGDEQAALGDAWWARSEKEAGDAKVFARKRAADWYAKCRVGLSGLTKARVEKRLAESRGEDRSPGLVGLWNFDEGAGSTAADGSGNGGVATLQPGASWGAGLSGGGLTLDGAQGFATVPDSAALNLGVDSFSVACFINFVGSAPYRVVNKWHLEAARGWILDINSQQGGNSNPEEYRGKLRCRIADGQIGVEHTVKPPLLPGVWTHITLVMDRGAREVRFYVDGEQVGPSQPFKQFGSVSNDVPLGIGRIPPSTGGFFNGTIDNLRIYRRVLAVEEIRALAAKK